MTNGRASERGSATTGLEQYRREPMQNSITTGCRNLFKNRLAAMQRSTR